MYFHEAIQQRIHEMDVRYRPMQQLAQLAYDYGLRASEIVNINQTVQPNGSNKAIIGKKGGKTQLITDTAEIERLNDFIDLWNSNYLKCSYSKYYNAISMFFADFHKVGGKRETATHLFRYAKAQKTYLVTESILSVCDAIREVDSKNAEIYVFSTFVNENFAPFTIINR